MLSGIKMDEVLLNKIYYLALRNNVIKVKNNAYFDAVGYYFLLDIQIY